MLLPYGFPLPLTPPSTTPSIIPLSLPSPSHISELLISGASQSGFAPPFSPSSLPSTFIFHSPSPPLAFCLPALLQQGPLPPSPVLQFTPKVSADPILPLSAIDVSLSEPLGSCVMQTRPTVGVRARARERTFPFLNQQPTFLFIFMVS